MLGRFLALCFTLESEANPVVASGSIKEVVRVKDWIWTATDWWYDRLSPVVEVLEVDIQLRGTTGQVYHLNVSITFETVCHLAATMERKLSIRF